MPLLSLTCQTVASALPSMDSGERVLDLQVGRGLRQPVEDVERARLVRRVDDGVRVHGLRDAAAGDGEAQRAAGLGRLARGGRLGRRGGLGGRGLRHARGAGGRRRRGPRVAAAAVVSRRGAAGRRRRRMPPSSTPSSSESPHAAAMAGSESAAPATRLRSRSAATAERPGPRLVVRRWPLVRLRPIVHHAPPRPSEPGHSYIVQYPDAGRVYEGDSGSVKRLRGLQARRSQQALSDVQLER